MAVVVNCVLFVVYYSQLKMFVFFSLLTAN